MKRNVLLTTLVIAAMMFMAWTSEVAFCLPQDPEVAHGEVDIQTPDADTMIINVSDPKAIINYSSFDIMEHETVNINLPSASAEILNRDMGVDASQILGTLNCNGIFILINTNGIYLGQNSTINAGSMILSTRDITDQRFRDGEYIFEKITEGQLDKILLNAGKINITEGGFGVLIAGAIENQGIITAKMGKIALAGGDAVKLEMSADGLVSVAILEPAAEHVYDFEGNPITDQLKNTGTLDADGGTVILKAESINDVFTRAVNLDGIVRATRVEEIDGSIHLVTDGEVVVSGAIDVNNIIIGDIEENIVPKAVSIEETANVNAEGLIEINARELITIESIMEAPLMTLRSQGGIDMAHAAIIQANTLNLVSRRFGTYEKALNLYADNIHVTGLGIYLTIAESQGLGTSILMRGPPDGWGSISYNSDTNLTLESSEGSILTGDGVAITATTLSLIAFGDIGLENQPVHFNTDTLLDIISYNGSVYLDSDNRDVFIRGDILTHSDVNIYAGTGLIDLLDATISSETGSVNLENTKDDILKNGINVYGTISAPEGIVRLWTCGALDMRGATVVSKEGGYIYNPEDEIYVEWDGDAGTTNWDDATNWSGDQVPNSRSYSVVIYSKVYIVELSSAYTIGDLYIGVNRSGQGNKACILYLNADLILDNSDPSGNLNGDIVMNSKGTLYIGAYNGGAPIAGSSTISMDGNFENDGGTFTANTGTVVFTDDGGTQTIDSGGSNFYNVTINNTGTSVQLITNDLTQSAGGALSFTRGTLDLNGQTWTLGANFTPAPTAAAVINLSTAGSALTGGANYDITLSDADMTVTQGDGTITCRDYSHSLGAHTISGTLNVRDFSHTGGTFTCSGTPSINVSGNAVITSAWTNTGSTINMTGAAKTINASQQINNLTIADAASASILTNDLDIAGNLTVGEGASGSFDTNSKNLDVTGTTTINSGATFNLDGTNAPSTFTTSNTITNNGTFTLENDNSTLAITGSGAQRTFTGNDINYNTNSATLTNIDYDPDVVLDQAGDTIVLGDSNCLFDGISIGFGGVASTFNAGAFDFTVSGDFARNAAGTFTSTGTVTFAPTVALTISGDNTFNNFTCTSAGTTLNFASGSTQTVTGTWTITGASGSLITLARSGGVDPNQWFINATAASVSFVSVSNSNSTNSITPTGSTDGGNNTNWVFPKTTFSGIVYSNEGVTPIGANITIAIAVNGAAAAATDDTDASGQYSLIINATLPGDIIIVYIDGETEKGCTVSLVTDADLSGLNIYQNRVIVRNDYAAGTGYTTNANLATADNGDADILYSVTGSDVTLTAGQELFVWGGDTYQPGGDITTTDLDIRGTLTPEGNTINLTGNFSNSGTFTPGTSTINFNGTTGTQTVDSGGSNFYNVTIDNSGTSVQLVNNDVTQSAGGVLTLTVGTLDLNGRTWKLGADFAPTPGNAGAEVDLTTAGSFLDGTGYDITIADKDLDITQGAGTITCQDYYHSIGVHTLSGTLNTRDFNHTGGTLTCSGTATINVSGNLVITGGWTNTGSTVNMTGVAKTIDSNKAFNNLAIADGATISFINNAPSVDGTLTIGEGTSGSFDTNSEDLTVSGVTTINAGGKLIVRNSTFNTNDVTNGGTVELYGTADFAVISIDNGQTFTNNGTVQILDDTFTVRLRADTGGTANFTGNDLDYNGRSITFFGIDYDPDVALDAAGDTIVLGDARCIFDGISIGVGGVISTFDSNGKNFEMSGNFLNTATGVWIAPPTITFNGTAGVQQVTAGGTNANHDFDNIIIDNSGTSVQLQDDLTQTAGSTLTMTQGTLDLNGNTFTLGADLTTAAGTIAIGTGTLDGATTYDVTVNTGGTVTHGTGTLNCLDFTVQGTGTYTCTGASAINVAGNTVITSANWDDGNSTITTSGAANTINSSETIYNLTISDGSGISMLTNALTVDNNLTVGGGASGTFGTNSLVLTVNGTTTVNAGATLTITSATFNANHITINGTMTDVGGNTINVSGNWTNNATFNAGTGNVIFIGAVNVTISGNTTFYNLTCTVGGKVLTFQAGRTQATTNLLTLRGGGTGNWLVLKSSSASSLYTDRWWYVDPQNGKHDILYVDVSDSYNIYGRDSVPQTYIFEFFPHDKGLYINRGNNNRFWFDTFDPDAFERGANEGQDWDKREAAIRATLVIPSSAGIVNLASKFVNEKSKRYQKNYPPGKYKTTVTVIEGLPATVAYYTERGILIDSAVVVKKGQSVSKEAVIS
ncbi:filamentous hemagglutinin N-terminal domain-containing protein [Candidatus Omnitrophota bacterium]